MRRHLIPIFLLIVLFAAVGFLILNTTWLLSYLIPQFINHHVEALEIKSIRIEKQKFQAPESIHLTGVKLDLLMNDQTFQCTISEVTLHKIFSLWKSDQRIKVELMGSDCQGGSANLKGANFVLVLKSRQNAIIHLDGVFSVEDFSYYRYNLWNVSGRLNADRSQFQIYEIKSDGYGGNIQGQVLVEFGPSPTYIIWAEVFGVNPKRMVSLHHGLFSQVHGGLNGSVRIKGYADQLDLFAVNLQFVDGGEIGPALLKDLISYVKNDRARSQLKTAMHNRKRIPLEKGSLSIQNSSGNRAIFTVHLENLKEQIRFKEILDVPLEDQFQRFFIE